MYMYVAGVHSVKPLDGDEVNPSCLLCRLINSVIERGIWVDDLEFEEELKMWEWWSPPFFADLGADVELAAGR